MRHAQILLPLLACGLTAQTYTWSTLPPPPQATAVAWDGARHRLVICGPGPQQRMWEWDGTAARERPLAMQNQPTVHQLTYDQRLGQVVAIGDASWSSYLVGTLDGAGWTWRFGGAAPQLDASTRIAFDHQRGRLVLYRGTPTGSTLHEWDGQQWWLVSDNQGPAARSGAAFAFDPLGQRCVLYGGDAGSGALADCWAWDGFAWTQLGAPCPPGPRTEAALGFDPFGSRLVLYGGASAGTDTWQLTGAQWTQLATVGDPGPQRRARLCADDQGLLLVPASIDQIVFDYDPSGTLWRLQGNRWQTTGHLVYPTQVNTIVPAYDRVRQQVVVFSGNSNWLPLPDRTQIYDRQWRHVAPAHQPVQRHSVRLCWSAPNQRVLLFGGGDMVNTPLDDTWTWDGSDWHQHPSALRPSPRWGHAFAEDPLGGVLLFGGTDGQSHFGDQWRWDGLAWNPVSAALQPAPRAFPMAGLDPVRNYVVLFGGFTTTAYFQDTWLWDGAAWTQATPTVVPTMGSSMAFRPETGRIAFVGGSARHEWTGTDWQVQPGLERGTIWRGLVTDPVHGRLLDVQPPSVAVFTARRAQVQRFGHGCSLGRVPLLDAIDEPATGVAFAVELGTQLAAAPAFFVVGLGTQNQPLGGGCSQLVVNPLAVNFALTSTGGVVRLPIPNDRSLRGVQFAVQGALWDPAGSPLGTVALTAGLVATIGD